MRSSATLQLEAATAEAPGEERLESFRAPVYRIALRMLGDVHEAQDVTQEVLLQLAARTSGARADLEAWATCVTLNRCRDVLRSHRLRCHQDDAGDLEAHVDPRLPADEALHRARLERDVQRALQALPTHYREVLILRDLEGQPYRRICEALGLPETNLKSRVIRARAALAELLAKSGVL